MEEIEGVWQLHWGAPDSKEDRQPRRHYPCQERDQKEKIPWKKKGQLIQQHTKKKIQEQEQIETPDERKSQLKRKKEGLRKEKRPAWIQLRQRL